MNISDFKEYFQDLVKPLGYKVWLGTKSKYNTRRYITNKEIIVEPFSFNLTSDGMCSVDTTLNIWIGVRREIDEKFTSQEEGDDTVFMDYMISEANNVYDAIKNSDNILITRSKQYAIAQYYEADSNATVNSQSFIRLSLPVRIYGFN